ncbi:carboxypeptidase M32 [uncultured Thiothrix sp.]|uniref:carboxypeptidase M32 n=1 Tax=uncultured Thiothrix sp. TaxID=223185 RepID=UPI002603B524|nr:carboxypeptidase M32 [uncultured Thiothrix sp.]
MANTEEKLADLKSRLLEVSDLEGANAVLGWDQSTYMPNAGANARGRQMATLGRLAQEKFTDPAIGQLLDDLQPYAASLPYEHDDAALIRATERRYQRDTQVPPAFIARLYAHAAQTYQVWAEARPANDFKRVQPYLEKTLELSRQMAEFYTGYEHIADPLIGLADYGMKASSVRQVFAELRSQLVPLVETITAQPLADDACLKQRFSEDEQLAFGRKVIERFGYDFNSGRQDKTHHPFMTKLGSGDVRITTRVKEDSFAEAFFSTTHEAGHALYEQGVNPAYAGTPLDGGTSNGVHESQSRTWENLVSRSRGFWEHYYPELQQAFPAQFKSVSLDSFYRAINKVERSLIRTEADEVTYNLHVMIRFELELQMLEGKLAVKDLPEAWHAAYQADLGIHAPNDINGCMQDVHWYGGHIGGVFQAYTLGNILSAQFFSEAVKAQPAIPSEIAQGEFSSLHGWLKENIYQYGSKYTAPELIERVTGRGLDIAPYMQYLRSKYGELYQL